jgi:hypothetical protein
MSILGDTHESRLDKGAWQSQSSTSGLVRKEEFADENRT